MKAEKHYRIRLGRFLSLVTIGALLLLAGCSAVEETTRPVDVDPEQLVADMTQYEDFDATPFEDPPPVIGVDIVHDVPESLMQSEAARDSRTLRTVQGFRIQVHSSLDKNAALRAEQLANQWWSSLAPEDRPEFVPSSMPVYLKYMQPYYRIRIGNFEDRSAAEMALMFVQDEFPNAFIAIDTVVVYR